MKTSVRVITLSICIIVLFASATWMEEGMWLLDAIEKLPLDQYRTHGLELTPQQIYNPQGTSLVDAIVLLPGGTGAFVSNEGLILTNHHIAFAGIQELSSVQDDYLKNGFLARTKEEELSTSYTAEIVVSIKDITGEIMSAVNEDMTPDERTQAVKTRLAAIQSSARSADPAHAFRTSEMYSGVKYYLFGYEVLRDVRLVYAPPEGIGNFGGEADNWVWPRHTGDFAMLRAYVGPDENPAAYAKENIPYTPRQFLPVSSRGPVEGSFAMVMGFPGRTFRYREFPAVALAHDQTLPLLIELYKTRVDAAEQIASIDRAVGIKYASKKRRLANSYKNYIGSLEGMRRADFVRLKQRETMDLDAFIRSSPERRARYGNILEEMQTVTDDYRTVNLKSLLFTNITGGVELIGVANRFLGFVNNVPNDSLGRPLPFSEREWKPMRVYIARAFRDFDVRVDKETLVALMLKSLEMPEGVRIAYFDKIAGRRTGADRERHVRNFVNDLYDDSRLTSQESAEKLMMRKPEHIKDDEFILFARALAAEQEPVTARVLEYNTRIAQLRTTYVQAWMEWKNHPVSYPDANRTLRLTYGIVESLNPRDAVTLSYITTLGGVMEKESGEDPFVVPPKLRELWEKRDFGSYADPSLGDVPVAFIANLDITGGNSGSPVINGNGELIGCAFDGNWESVVGDYYYQDRYNRSINVDSRYILFVLDKFDGAENIIRELVIR